MVAEDERSFSPESPVGKYWLLNCVGFRVERTRVTYGVVEQVGPGDDGVDVLRVRRRGPLGRRLVLVRADRVASIHPWEDTIVLAARSPAIARRREPRERPASLPVRERAAQLERRLRPHATAAALAVAGAFSIAWAGVRRAALFVARAVARASTFAAARSRAYAPVVRQSASSLGKTTLATAAAYVAAARRYVGDVRQVLDQTIEHRRAARSVPPAEAPVDEIDGRRSADWPLRRESAAETQVGLEVDTEAPPRRRAG
jgi:hypothetical protein